MLQTTPQSFKQWLSRKWVNDSYFSCFVRACCLLSFFISGYSFDQLGLEGRMGSTVISYSGLRVISI